MADPEEFYGRHMAHLKLKYHSPTEISTSVRSILRYWFADLTLRQRNIMFGSAKKTANENQRFILPRSTSTCKLSGSFETHACMFEM